MRYILSKIFLLLLLPSMAIAAGGSDIKLKKAVIDLSDYASLQRGATTYMNYCSGCHSLQFMRYNSMAQGIGITDEAGEIYEEVVKSSFIPKGGKITDQIGVAMSADKSEGWFGKAPPDLSLVSRSRGVDWLYNYMIGFYKDDSKTWGVNNLVYKDVGMPHVLVGLQGIQELKGDLTKSSKNEYATDLLKLSKPGKLSAEEYDKLVLDLVNFLSYVGEPVQLERKKLGIWVLMFLGFLSVFSFLMKREYWKDVS